MVNRGITVNSYQSTNISSITHGYTKLIREVQWIYGTPKVDFYKTGCSKHGARSITL